MARGDRETALFQAAILKNLNSPRNLTRPHWSTITRWRLWLWLFEESAEVFAAYLVLCWREAVHGKRNSYATLLALVEARQRLREECGDLAACLLFLLDNTGSLQ
jgi:hypothetical protein